MPNRMKTLLICHEDAEINRHGLSRWLASFSQLTGMVVLREPRGRLWKRTKRELRRIGPARFLDMAAFRLYYRFFLAGVDQRWQQAALEELTGRYPDLPADLPILVTHSPNSPEAEAFIREQAPDIILARCKSLLSERIFTIPPRGTLVMHPGICPEYRNAHGCFWALAQDDLARVGMTLLRIDRGVDTGPIFGHYSYRFNELAESHIVIQHKTVLENLPALQEKMLEIYQGTATPIDTSGRPSREWGQPWLTAYAHWRRAAKRRARCA
ncbi:MAG: formyltransferase family protein [Armatimonadota bacterium]